MISVARLWRSPCLTSCSPRSRARRCHWHHFNFSQSHSDIMQRRKSRCEVLAFTFLLLFLYVNLTKGQEVLRHKSLKQSGSPSIVMLAPARNLHLTTTLCQDYCKTGCISYVTPFDECYNPQKIFPSDESWGNEDVLDANVTFSASSTITFDRTFYATLDGTCGGTAESQTLPLNECVGPFGAPRPWGKFEFLP